MNTILFDMDGTLLDTLSDLTESVNFALRECGYSQVSMGKVREVAGYGSIALMDDLTENVLSCESPEFKALLATFTAHYGAHHNDKTRPYDGIRELLAGCKERGIRMGIVSNKADADVAALRELWFSGLVDVSVGRIDGIPAKPAPDMVFRAMEELGATASETIYVGDSEPDAQVAAAAGCTGVCCSWGFRDRVTLEAQHPDYIVDTPEELLRLIDGLA